MGTRKVRGFTLIEMLVVLAVIGLVAGLLLPAAMRAGRVARKAQCANNLRQMAIAFEVYLTDSLYIYPPASVISGKYGQKEWMDLIRPKMSLGTLDDGIQLLNEFRGPNWNLYRQFDCPSNTLVGGGSGQFPYGYNLNCVGLNYNTLKASDMVVVHCANHFAPGDITGRTANPGIHDGFDNYLFADGHWQASDAFYKKLSTESPWLSKY
jgi:prepilin-type N-terminal cleavage/methylation domain-containing protein